MFVIIDERGIVAGTRPAQNADQLVGGTARQRWIPGPGQNRDVRLAAFWRHGKVTVIPFEPGDECTRAIAVATGGRILLEVDKVEGSLRQFAIWKNAVSGRPGGWPSRGLATRASLAADNPAIAATILPGAGALIQAVDVDSLGIEAGRPVAVRPAGATDADVIGINERGEVAATVGFADNAARQPMHWSVTGRGVTELGPTGYGTTAGGRGAVGHQPE